MRCLLCSIPQDPARPHGAGSGRLLLESRRDRRGGAACFRTSSTASSPISSCRRHLRGGAGSFGNRGAEGRVQAICAWSRAAIPKPENAFTGKCASPRRRALLSTSRSRVRSMNKITVTPTGITSGNAASLAVEAPAGDLPAGTPPNFEDDFALLHVPPGAARKYAAALANRTLPIGNGSAEFMPAAEPGTYEPFVQRICRVTPALRPACRNFPADCSMRGLPWKPSGSNFMRGQLRTTIRRTTFVLVNTQDQADFVDSFKTAISLTSCRQNGGRQTSAALAIPSRPATPADLPGNPGHSRHGNPAGPGGTLNPKQDGNWE